MANLMKFDTPNERRYSLGEEIANSITHGIGALLSAAAIPLLMDAARQSSDTLSLVGYAIFGVSLVLLFTMSTVYHAVTAPRAKKILEILDHSAVYVLIAGTYSAYCFTALRGPAGWTLFGLVWGTAAAGIVFKAFFVNRFRIVSTLGYVVMGWLIAPWFGAVKANIPSISLTLLIAGGLAYTLGAAIYLFKKVPWFHPLWHIFVLAGAVCHFFSAYLMFSR